jgi:hypothetical protein
MQIIQQRMDWNVVLGSPLTQVQMSGLQKPIVWPLLGLYPAIGTLHGAGTCWMTVAIFKRKGLMAVVALTSTQG